ncbi:coiled-coil domain-containing protein 141 [Pholidichthys leucotaenia]
MEKPFLSFTTLTTIAVEAGRSQIIVSVLQSGSLIHLQLVQTKPRLCEIGRNQDETQTLIKEQQQLLEKLKRHEPEVLAVVEKRRAGQMVERKRNGKEEDVYKAMEASLSEGWSVLLHLLQRRLEVLKFASEFYCCSVEFAESIDRLENVQIEPDDNRLAEVQLTYDSMRRGKSSVTFTLKAVPSNMVCLWV